MNPQPSDAPAPVLARGVRSFDRACQHGATQWQFDWHFAPGDRAFAGHFPHHPILPGVFLLEMAQRAAEWALQQSLERVFRISRVERMRFIAPVRPGDGCTLMLDWSSTATASSTEALKVNVRFNKPHDAVAHGSMQARAVSET